MKHIKACVEVLSASEIEQIDGAARTVLEQVGAHVPNQEVLKLCAENGAEVDYQQEKIRIPKTVIGELIEALRARKVLEVDTYIRKPKAKISTQIYMYDYRTQTRRLGLADDVLKGICLLNQLESFETTKSIVIPSDVPEILADIVSFHMLFTYSTKPGGTYVLSAKSAPYIIAMLKAMGRPCSYFLETVSPLGYQKTSLDIALAFAREGGTLTNGPMVMAGATGPMSIAGTMTLATAEILLSIFVNYSLTGKLDEQYSNSCHTMDPQTMLCSFGLPNQALFAAASAQMARYYGLRCATNSAMTDALACDFQNGMEKATGLVFAALSGCASTGCMGIAGADQGLSLEQIVLDNEMFRYVNYILDGFEVNEHALAVEAIREVGIGGNFLYSEHTLDYLHSDYLSSNLFAREAFGGNRTDLLDRAAQLVTAYTKDYKALAPVIPEEKAKELDYILACARKELA